MCTVLQVHGWERIGAVFLLPFAKVDVICVFVSQPISETSEQLAARAGRAGFDLLYERFGAHLLAYLTRLAGHSHADDLAQDVWVKVHQALPKEFSAGAFKPWLFSVAKNQHVDFTRKKPLAELKVDLADNGPSQFERMLDTERHGRLSECMEKLRESNSRSAEVFTALLGGQAAEEICGALKLEAQQVYNIKNKTITFLQECVSREHS